MLKVLATGAGRLIGQKVVELASERGREVHSIYKEHTINLGIPIKLDLTNRKKLQKVISKRIPKAIIHTAAYTDVDGCEINRDLAWKVSAEATKHLAIASASINSHLTCVSIDYVFDAQKGFYTEEDKPNPISYYSYTKLKGKELIREDADQWCVARPSVICGWSPEQKPNFATLLFNNLNQGKEAKVLTDQYVSPTSNTNLAEMHLEIAEGEFWNVTHTKTHRK